MSLPDAAWIRAHIPHQGRMCLLDRVLDWDEQHIRCQALMPTLADHPLREDGVLSSLTGIEYAAQAMAVHGALLHGHDLPMARHGLLTAVHQVQWQVPNFLDNHFPLVIEARQLAGTSQASRYAFQVTTGSAALVSGQASLFFTATREPLVRDA